MKRWYPLAAAAAVTAGMLAACSTGGEPAPESSTTGSAEPTVDLTALDPGAYPTEPRPPFGVADDSQLVQVESQRMAQFIVVPFEVDPDLTAPDKSNAPITSRRNLVPHINADAATIPANDALLGGFSSLFTTAPTERDNPRGLHNIVLRYETAADARAAAQQLAQVSARQQNSPVNSLPGVEGAYALETTRNDKSYFTTYTPHGVYVIYEFASSLAVHSDQLEPMARKAIALQSALIDRFPRTPTAAENAARGNGGGFQPPKMDENSILIYALPYTDTEMENGITGRPQQSMRAVYGPRGLSHFSTDPASTFNDLRAAGSTANALERSIVHRADTEEQAATLVVTSDADDQKIDPPPGLPTANCSAESSADGRYTIYHCMVQVGRYVGHVQSPNKTDVYQQAAAQYLILTKADQNAK